MKINFLYNLVRPRSKDEDSKRQEFILNVLLLGTISLTFVALMAATMSHIKIGSFRIDPDLLSLYVMIFVIMAIFVGLFFLSRKGFFRLSSFVLISLLFLPNLFSSIKWGFELPQSLLIYALIIVTSGILINTSFAWIMTLIISLSMILISYMQVHGFIEPVLFWKQQKALFSDGIVMVVTLGIITIVSWLSNREIERSLKRAILSESALKKERDLLEIRVEERTKELKEAQREKMVQLTKFAEFGKLASGIFHDLSNPLTAASLNLEEINRGKKDKLEEVTPYIEKALKATKRVEEFVGSVRKQIQQQDVQETFRIKKEVNEALEVLEYKAQKAEVQLQIEGSNTSKLYGNPLKFTQVITNLVSNAIDSYDKFANPEKRCVLISCKEDKKNIIISIQDWGKGISPSFLTKVFDPFFTTKNIQHGTGIGLSIVKEVVEEDFNGKIDLESEENKGTTFTIKIPSK